MGHGGDTEVGVSISEVARGSVWVQKVRQVRRGQGRERFCMNLKLYSLRYGEPVEFSKDWDDALNVL